MKHSPAKLVILGICLLAAGYYINLVVRWLPYHNQIDYGEGLIMYINNMWATGAWKWDMNVPPYLPLMYGVGMPLVNFPLIKIFGDGLWTGRLIEVISTVGVSVIFYFIVSKVTGKKLYGLIAALLPFTQPIIRDWSLQARVDMLAVFFDVVGLYLFWKYKDSRNVYWSVVLFAAAFFTRIGDLAGLGAALIWLLIYNRKLFLRYGGLMVAVIAIVLAGLQVWSGGAYFQHVFLVNMTDGKYLEWVKAISNIAATMLPLIIMLGVIVFCIHKIWRDRENSIFLWFLIVAAVIDIVTEMKPAGFINYFVEFIMAACLLSAILLPHLSDKVDAWMRKYQLITAALIMIVLIINLQHVFPFPNAKYDREVAVTEGLISDTSMPVVTENSALVMNAGKEIYGEWFIIQNWSRLGMWDDTNFTEDFKNQKFDYLVLRIPLEDRLKGDGHFNQAQIAAMAENYTAIYDPVDNVYWYGIHVYEANRKYANDSRFRDQAVMP